MKQRIAIVGALALTLVASAQAGTLSIADSSWKTIGVPGETETLFQVEQDGSLSVVSDNAVAFRSRVLDTVGNTLSWRWRVA